MAVLDVSCLSSWHAHVYFDSASRDAAANLRAVVLAQFGDRIAFTNGKSGHTRDGAIRLRLRRPILGCRRVADTQSRSARRVRASQYGQNCEAIAIARFGLVEATSSTCGR